jgi:tetratricopeptide (TPR) repeat protein
VPCDLDTIWLTAMAKEPGRRYASARAFVDDLRAFLDGRPIQARPLGTLGRLRLACRRHPRVAVLVALLIAVFLTGFCGVLWEWRRAEANLATAQDEHHRAEENFAEAEKKFREALGAFNSFYTLVSENKLLHEPGMQPLRRDLLAAARDYYARFVQERRDDPTLEDELAKALQRLAGIIGEIDTPERSLDCLHQLVALQEKQVRQRPEDVATQAALAEALVLEASTSFEAWRLDEAMGLYERGIDLARRLVERSPARPEGHKVLGIGYHSHAFLDYAAGDSAGTEVALRNAAAAWTKLAELYPTQPGFLRGRAAALNSLTWLYLREGQLSEAEKAAAEAKPLADKLIQDWPKVADFHYLSLALGMGKLTAQVVRARALPPHEAARRLHDIEAEWRRRMDRFAQVPQLNPRCMSSKPCALPAYLPAACSPRPAATLWMPRLIAARPWRSTPG